MRADGTRLTRRHYDLRGSHTLAPQTASELANSNHINPPNLRMSVLLHHIATLPIEAAFFRRSLLIADLSSSAPI